MSQGYFDYDPEELDFAVFDIETTGLCAADGDIVTTVVMYHNDTYNIWFNTDGDSTDAITEEDITADVDEVDSVSLNVWANETELFNAINRYINGVENLYNEEEPSSDGAFNDNTVLTAYNGETYRGGFDIPFCRSRNLMSNATTWMFDGVWYADSYDVFVKQGLFNTTHQDTIELSSFTMNEIYDFADDAGITYTNSMNKTPLIEHISSAPEYSQDRLITWIESSEDMELPTSNAESLDEIHELLFENGSFTGMEYSGFDPFEESSEAVEAYDNGNYVDIIKHCLSDVVRTVNLTDAMVTYAPQKSYRPKTL